MHKNIPYSASKVRKIVRCLCRQLEVLDGEIRVRSEHIGTTMQACELQQASETLTRVQRVLTPFFESYNDDGREGDDLWRNGPNSVCSYWYSMALDQIAQRCHHSMLCTSLPGGLTVSLSSSADVVVLF